MKRSSIESSLKRFLKRKVKITLGVVVVFLITGAVGYGADDIAAQGETKVYTATDVGNEKPKIIGGWNYTTDQNQAENHSGTNTNITLTSGTVDELIGGNHLKKVDYKGEAYLHSIGNTSVTMNGGTAQYLIGGSKSNGTNANIENGITTVVVNGGTIGTADPKGVTKAALIGGNYIKSKDGYGTSITAKTEGTNVEITGGTFLNKVIGGSFAETYTAPISGLTVEDKETKLKISGGTFKDIVIGGGAAAGEDNTSAVGTSNLLITGGTFDTYIYAGGAALISGTGQNDLGTAKVTNSNLTIDGTGISEGSLKFDFARSYGGVIFAGGLNSGVSDTIKLTLKNLKKEVFKTNTDLHGGSRATAGNTIKDGNIEVNILNSSLNGDGGSFGDLYAGGEADGAGAKITTGKSTLILNDFSAGRRIFGSGRVLDNGIFEQESTDIQLNNVIGKQLYGGGWNRKNIAASVDNSSQSLKVGTTKMIIDGEKTEFYQVFGGSIISGTGNKGTVSVGETDITINNGKITGCVAGGNFSNWFGYSVVGKENINGTYSFNEKKYNSGKTNVTINNGDLSGADIIGGSYTEHQSSGESDYERKAFVFGDTNININGGKLGLVIGGGEAAFWSFQGSDPATESHVEGTTNINITGGNLLKNIIGGGYAFQEDEVGGSIANVTGTTNINISGGTIEKNIYGGGYADGKSATANVDGDTNITISGGTTILGDIYAGGLVANEGTANVTGNATVTFLNGLTSTGSTFAKNVYGLGKDALATSKSTLAFGNDTEKFDGEFKGEFSNFDVLRTGKDSKVIIGELNKDNINRDIEITGSGRIETAINEADGDITLSGGTLAADGISFKEGKKLTLSSKGILETKSGNIFTNALDKEGTAEKNSGTVRTDDSIVYNGGSVALNDKNYNLDYLKTAISSMNKASENKTTILMLGNLVNTAGEIQGDISIEEAAGLGENALLDNVTTNVGEGNTSLVIGDTSGSSTGTASTNSNLNASILNFDSGTEGDKTIAIKDKDSKLVLGGSKDGELVTVDGKAPAKNVKIDVTAGTLVLGSDFSSGANQTLSAGVTIGSDSGSTGTLEVNAGNQTVTGTIENKATGIIAVNENAVLNAGTINNTSTTGTVAVNKDAALKAKTVENKGTLNVAGNAEIGSLTGGAGSTITVGDSSSAGTLVVERLKLDGGKMFLDPAWIEGGSNLIGNASKGAVIFEGANGIDGKIAVGQNSVLVIGAKDTKWAEKAFENSGLKWRDNITAALAIKGKQTLANTGSVNVNGSLQEGAEENLKYKDAGYLNFDANSLLIVDVGSLNGNDAAISGVTGLTVEDSSKLYLENATAGTHTILAGNGVSSKGWDNGNILSSDRMLNVSGNKSGNDFKVEATAKKAQDVLLGVVVPNMIDNIWGVEKNNNTDSSNEGIKFLSRAMSDTYIADTAEAVQTINSAVQMAAAGGVHRTAIDTVRRTSDTALENLSLKNETSINEGLWAEMSYGSTDVSGVKVGNTDTGYNGRYEGVSVGSSFKTWENGALGGAFHYVSGENKSDEGFNRTKNEYEYFGLSLYSNWRKGNFNIIGDLGYSKGDNEIKQDTSIAGRIKADVDTEVATAGIRGEYLIKKDNFNIMPYAGLRYVRLSTDDFDTKNGNGKMFHTEKEDADLFLVPVGVNISTQGINQNGWTVKPNLDLAYIGALGDKKSETKVGVAGYSAMDKIKVDMADSSAFSGSLGLEFKKDNKAFEVGYNLYSSKHETENRGTLSFKYNF